MESINLKGKKLLIMGATAQTVPFVETAKEMGIITYVADHLEDSVAKKYADRPLLVNCLDVDALEKIVRDESIDGVLVGCADILVPYYAELAERTGKFCYVTGKQASVLGNKKGLKKSLRKYGLPTIPEYFPDEYGNYETIKFHFPVFVKPVDNNSAKGMSVCYCEEEFEAAKEKALAASRSKTILVEDYMVCDDITVSYTLVDGEVHVVSIYDRYVNREQKGVGTIPTGLLYPSKYTDLYFETAHDKVCKMFPALDMKNGVLSIQAFVCDGKIMFYDPAFRTTGGQGYLFYKYFGMCDQIKMLIRFALTGSMVDEKENIKWQCNFGSSCAMNLVILIKTGVIGKIEGLEQIKDLPGVLNITQCHFEGDGVTNYGTLDQTLARLHLIADSKENLRELIKKILNLVKVVDCSGNNMLLGQQFDYNEL
ncbi:MAG: hypothetical protein LUH58_05435 [Lachnospiraceae bacterium]|nr:hypothetical protein [Lachnospiraceae bacterium]